MILDHLEEVARHGSASAHYWLKNFRTSKTIDGHKKTDAQEGRFWKYPEALNAVLGCKPETKPSVLVHTLAVSVGVDIRRNTCLE